MKGNVQSNAMREFCLTCLTFQQVSLQGSDKIQGQLASDEGFQVVYVSVKGGFLWHTAPAYPSAGIAVFRRRRGGPLASQSKNYRGSAIPEQCGPGGPGAPVPNALYPPVRQMML
jgi:hypothetical protein